MPADFEAFYRECLRWRCGRRVSATELRDRYHAWGLEVEAQSLSFKQLRAAMMNIGHRHATSNGTWYFDIEFADRVPGVADNFPDAPADTPPAEVRR